MFCGCGRRISGRGRGGEQGGFWKKAEKDWRRGGTEGREEGGVVTLINDQHVAVPQRQHRHKQRRSSTLAATMGWLLAGSLAGGWPRSKKRRKDGRRKDQRGIGPAMIKLDHAAGGDAAKPCRELFRFGCFTIHQGCGSGLLLRPLVISVRLIGDPHPQSSSGGVFHFECVTTTIGNDGLIRAKTCTSSRLEWNGSPQFVKQNPAPKFAR